MTFRQRLVIDANILRAAGAHNAINPASRNCRAVLFSILTICHKATLCATLREEWDKHQSKYALKWRSAMQKKGKLIDIQVTVKTGLRQSVLDNCRDAISRQEAATKDFHLVEAAIETDWIVISADNTVREIFADACRKGDKLSEIVWVHPDDEDILDWLADGAIRQQDKQLSAYKTDR